MQVMVAWHIVRNDIVSATNMLLLHPKSLAAGVEAQDATRRAS